jgi:hypothetical protein
VRQVNNDVLRVLGESVKDALDVMDPNEWRRLVKEFPAEHRAKAEDALAEAFSHGVVVGMSLMSGKGKETDGPEE